MLQDEYYVIERENNDNYPLFAWDQSKGKYNKGKPVEYTEPLKFCLDEPVPRKFEWADYHALPDSVIWMQTAGSVIRRYGNLFNL